MEVLPDSFKVLLACTDFNLQGGFIMSIRKFTCLVVAVFVTSFSGIVHAEDIAKSVAVRLARFRRT